MSGRNPHPEWYHTKQILNDAVLLGLHTSLIFLRFLFGIFSFSTNQESDHMSHSHICDCRRCRKPYGCMSFLFDLIMVFLTGGLWLIWIFVREMRNR